MPLIDLKTNLKSLKFGKDRPGGGSSNQPYIQTPIPDDNKQGIPPNKDFLLRGGLSAPINAAKDVSRLTQMFFDLKDPSGLLFTAKENLLSRTGVKTEASTTAGAIYTPLSTLGQSAIGFAGGHLNLLGLDPTGLSSLGVPKYGDYMKSLNNIDGAENFNRLVSLSDKFTNNAKIGGRNKITLYPNGQRGDTFMEYGGGPGSILGIGKTRIKFADQRTGENNPQFKNNNERYTKGGRKNSQSTLTLPPLGVANKWFSFTQNNDSASYPNLITNGGYTYELDFDNSTTKSGSLELNDQLSTGKFKYDIDKLKYNKFLGASNKEGLDQFDTGINESGQFTTVEGRVNDNSTLSKDNKGLTLTGSNAYQSGRKNSGTEYTNIPLTDTYKNLVLNGEGASKKYNSTEGKRGDISEDANYLSSTKINSTTIPSNITSKVKDHKINTTGSLGASSKYNELTKSGSIDTSIFGFFNDQNVYVPGSFPKTNPQPLGSNTFSQQQIIDVDSNVGKKIGKPKVQDFRTPLLKNSGGQSTIMSNTPAYTKAIIDKRVGMGNPGESKNVYSYGGKGEILDVINGSEIQTDKSVAVNIHGGKFNDLVKFSIGVLQNNNTGKADYMNFRSIIDSFDDSYTSGWGDTQYVGRGDKFHNYTGFDRTISMGFTVYAQSKAELAPMYRKLNFLASSLAPSYSSGGFMQGNLVYLTVGGYLFQQLGFIRSLTYSIPQESTWEIGINDGGKYDNSVKELPHMIKVTGLSFTPIHDFVPRKANPKGQKQTRYIAMSRGVDEQINYKNPPPTSQD